MGMGGGGKGRGHATPADCRGRNDVIMWPFTVAPIADYRKVIPIPSPRSGVNKLFIRLTWLLHLTLRETEKPYTHTTFVQGEAGGRAWQGRPSKGVRVTSTSNKYLIVTSTSCALPFAEAERSNCPITSSRTATGFRVYRNLVKSGTSPQHNKST